VGAGAAEWPTVMTATASTSAVDLIAELASQGDADLATVHAIRLLAAWEGDDGRSVYPKALAQVLNDLAVLRSSRGDRMAARGALRMAIGLDPGHPHAVDNLFAVEAAVREHGTGTGLIGDLDPQRTNLNPWVVDALEGAAALVGYDGKDVLEIGGVVPREAALATGARTWTATDLGAVDSEADDSRYLVRAANACALPFPDNSFDAAFSSCAFEHIFPMEDALAELRRVLRPGGRLYSKFAPIWSGALGHHLWMKDADGVQLSIEDQVIPDWGHLLLTEREMEAFLRLSLGAERAAAAVQFVYRSAEMNRLTDGDHRRGYDASGLEQLLVQPWVNGVAPSPATAEELAWLNPDAGDFTAFGFTLVLGKEDVIGYGGADSRAVTSAPADLVQTVDAAILLPWLGAGETMLSLGSGEDRYTELLLGRHQQVVVADTPDAVDRLAHRFDGHPGLVLLPLGAAGLGALPETSITRAFSFGLVETLPHSVLLRYLVELRRALVPGGRVAIEHPDTFSDAGWDRFLVGVDAEANGGAAVTLLTPELFRALAERAGLTVEDTIGDLVEGACITLLTRPS
jgi:SAM-dependent methyltransferase